MIDVLALPGARAIFSTRQGGVSDGPYRSLNLGILTDDDASRVVENRARLARAASVDAVRVVMGWQVHGTDLREWDGPDPINAYAEPGGKQLPRVDGHLTAERGLALLVLVADCFPVALSDGHLDVVTGMAETALYSDRPMASTEASAAVGATRVVLRDLRRDAGVRRRIWGALRPAPPL